MDGFYCTLLPEIQVDDELFDFLVSDYSNFVIIKQNPDLTGYVKEKENFIDDNITNYRCIAKPDHPKNDPEYCDSIVKLYKIHNI